ncbi:MAG: choice-of-anchor I family protein [Saprospiraceae bacterium]|nr:choice-of-anchor I family protein [Saprospiraceae bacterium]
MRMNFSKVLLGILMAIAIYTVQADTWTNLLLRENISLDLNKVSSDPVTLLTPLPAATISLNTTTAEEKLTTEVIITVTTDGPASGNQTIGISVSGSGITASDYYLTKSTITILSGQMAGTAKLIVADDAIPEGLETATVTLINAGSGLTIGLPSSADLMIVDNTCSFLTHTSTITSVNGAEISAYDATSSKLFAVAGEFIEEFNLNASGQLSLIGILSNGFTAPAGFAAIPNSVAVKNGILAASFAIRNTTTGAQDSGVVAFFQTSSSAYIHHVKVGHLPDMVTFTPGGTKVLTANEGEPNSYGQATSFDPEGSVSIIDISGGINNASVTTAGFQAFNGQINTLKSAGVRIYGPGATVSQDLEPEYIAFSADGTTAVITLQENNAFATLDLATSIITQIIPLGLKDHSLANAGLDASDRDSTSSIGKININTWPLMGMYQPDAIASFTQNELQYYITANEGDSRDYTGFSEEIRVGSLSYALDPMVFPNAATLKNNANLGRLQLTKATGDVDADGDFDQMHALGARSFTIWNGAGSLVYDSGDALEKMIAQKTPTLFNSEGTAAGFDSRSDNKGPEPEGVAVGNVFGTTYAFLGLERTGDVVVYDLTNPTSPAMVQYINMPQDLAVEGLLFIPAEQSPTNNALLITAAEGSRTISVFEIAKSYIAQYVDEDGDGFGATSQPIYACGLTPGYADNDLDCDDQNETVYPEADDLCDGIDNDCDQMADEDCGCTNQDAYNYNPNALFDDGSCITCSDGIQNGTETGVDCGGTFCNACPAPVAVCGNIVTVYANAGNLTFNGPGTADVYLIPAEELDAGSSFGPNMSRTVARKNTNVAFNWTTNGACIDAIPNGIYNNSDRGILQRNCLPVSPADFNKVRNFDMVITDNYGSSACSGRYIVINDYPNNGGSTPEELAEQLAFTRSSKANVLMAYPNPGSSYVTVYLKLNDEVSDNTISIIDALGNVCLKQEGVTNNVVTFETASLTPGMYFISHSGDNFSDVIKWIKID